MPTEEQLQIASDPNDLKELIRRNKRPQIWRPPTFYNPRKPDKHAALMTLLATGKYETVQELEEWATAISEIQEPSDLRRAHRAKIYDEVMAQGDMFGVWVADHHLRTVTQIAERDLFWRVRTGRNFPLITLQEQKRLSKLHIVTIGQSVGSSATIACAEVGIGGIHTILDFDILSWSNLNRIPVGIDEVGANKVVVTANRLTGMNPYIEQRHYYTGATDESLEEIFAFIQTLDPRKTILIEAIDKLEWKHEIRRLAKLHGIAVIMPTDNGWGGGGGDIYPSNGTVQVERHDVEPDAPFFDDRLEPADLAVLASKRPLSRRDKGGYALRIIGPVSRRMAGGMLEIGNTTTNFCQLGPVARIQGSGAAMAAFRIGLGYDLPSGWYSVQELCWLNDQL